MYFKPSNNLLLLVNDVPAPRTNLLAEGGYLI